MMFSCKEAEDLPYYMSWSKHCGGSSQEFLVRTVGMASTGSEAWAGVLAIGAATGPVGWFVGAMLLAKAYNDYQESWQGRNGYIRNGIGSELYDTIDLLISFRAATRLVKKKSAYGTDKFDLFIRDKGNLQRAYKQFGMLEMAHWGASVATNVTGRERGKIVEVETWCEHLENLESCRK